MSFLRGLDVSVYQGPIDWLRVPPEFAFVIGRASIGTAGLDALYAKNHEGARATGRLWGAYCFLLPDYPVDQQIEAFKRAIGEKLPALPLVIDLETVGKGQAPQQVVDALRRAVDDVDRFADDAPLVYSYPAYLRQLGAALERATDLRRCGLFLADYAHGEQPPEGTTFAKVPLWDRPTLVQTSGNGSSRVPGIAGAVDHDVYLGDMHAFRVQLCGLPDQNAIETEPELGIVHPDVEFPPREPPTEE